jgi:hypothetical protein
VHVTVWSIANSGIQPSSGPAFKQEGDYPVSNGSVTALIPKTIATSAYFLIVTPATSLSSVSLPYHYEAEYADLSGSAYVADGKEKGHTGVSFVEGYRSTGNAATEFAVTAPEDGYYELSFHYSKEPLVESTLRKVGVTLNGSRQNDFELSDPLNQNAWATQKKRYFLAGGINLFCFFALADGSTNGLQIDGVDLVPAVGPISVYQADDPSNTFTGTAKLSGDTLLGHAPATQVGGANSFLQFNNVAVPASGKYLMIVSYFNKETGHGGQVERRAEISINGGVSKSAYFRNTFDEIFLHTNVIDVELSAGKNTIRFSNPHGYTPDIYRIQIATQ